MEKSDFYKDLYAKYNSDTTKEDRVSKIVSFLGSHHYDKFLDIACGDGGLTVIIAETIKAKETKAVEISAEGTEEAKAKGIDCYRIDLDKDALPFKNEYFDFVFCGEIIEHVFDTDKLMEELYRVLAPGGKLIITTPNLGSWINRIYLLFGFNPFWCSVSLKHHDAGKLLNKSSGIGKEHIRFFTFKALKDLLKYNNFKILKTFGFYARTTAMPISLLNSMINSVDYLFSRVHSLSSMIGIYCEKTDSSGISPRI